MTVFTLATIFSRLKASGMAHIATTIVKNNLLQISGETLQIHLLNPYKQQTFAITLIQRKKFLKLSGCV